MKILEYFVTETQAAEVLGVNPKTILRWAKSGRVEAQQIGRVLLIPKWQIEILKQQHLIGGQVKNG
jgi:excisionase family DNA binding protein